MSCLVCMSALVDAWCISQTCFMCTCHAWKHASLLHCSPQHALGLPELQWLCRQCLKKARGRWCQRPLKGPLHVVTLWDA